MFKHVFEIKLMKGVGDVNIKSLSLGKIKLIVGIIREERNGKNKY